MTQFVGNNTGWTKSPTSSSNVLKPTGLSANAYTRPVPNQVFDVETFGLEYLTDRTRRTTVETQNNAQAIPKQFNGNISRWYQDWWFERVLAVPGEIALGNVLSSQTRDLELLNNYREQTISWLSFVNNAGSGIDVTGVPTLPSDLNPLQSLLLQVSISTQGPPTISGTLDFTLDVGGLSVPVSGSRVILFPYVPEGPVKESLEFNTTVLVNEDGSEQRMSLRAAPRQLLEFSILLDSDNERDRLSALLFDWQSRVFGVPIWWEERELAQDATAGASTFFFDTAYGDFRVGGLVLLLDAYNDFEVFEISSLTASSVTVLGTLAADRKAGVTRVVPARTAVTDRSISMSRYPTGPTLFNIPFITLDNEYLGDASAFASYNSKALVDWQNAMGRTVGEGYKREFQRLDNGTAPLLQLSGWSKSKPEFNLGLRGKSLQETWQIRQFFHYLTGRRLTFYLGTGRTDLKVLFDVADTSNQIDVEFIDFTTFYQQATPRSDIRIVRKDGTWSAHSIVGSSIVTPNQVERLTLSPAITPALPLSAIERVEFLTLTRLATDVVTAEHLYPGESVFTVPVIGVPA